MFLLSWRHWDPFVGPECWLLWQSNILLDFLLQLFLAGVPILGC